MSSHVGTADYRGTEQLNEYVEALTEPDWALGVRRKSLQRFAEMSWPTTQDEEWRRSDISVYDFDSYAYGLPKEETAESEADLADRTAAVASLTMEQWNGATLSDEAQKNGVQVMPLGAFLRSIEAAPALHSEVLSALNRDIENIDHRIQAWHYAAYNCGVAVYVPSHVELADPIRVSVRATGDERLIAPHLLVMAETGASIRVVHTVTGEEEGEVLYNEGATLVVKDGAGVDFQSYYDLNIDSIAFSHCFAYLGRDARLRHFTGAFGGMFAKHRTDVHVIGEGADAQINGLYFAREDQHMDLRTVQYHEVGNGGSRTFYKGAVQDEGRTVYQGLIEVAHGADQTDAYLTNNNLILNDGARADSIPSLKIETDDVKCSHGSTTGKIDPEYLYYLETRGYSDVEAREIIVEGYFEEVAAGLDDSLAERIRGVVHDRLVED